MFKILRACSITLMACAGLGHAAYALDFAETKMLAEKGDAASQYNLGISYSFGRGIAPNKAEAAKWYQKAAEQGAHHPMGMIETLGKIHIMTFHNVFDLDI